MLSHEHPALFAVMITFIWSMFGTNLIVFLAGMATIDPALYDAARVDGASSSRCCSDHGAAAAPVRAVRFIITLVTAFTALFSLIFVMTGGGPGFGTTTLEFYIYQEAFSDGRLRHAATAGAILFVVVAVVSVLQLRLLRGRDDDVSLRFGSRALTYAVLAAAHRRPALPVLLHGPHGVPVDRPVPARAAASRS